MTFDTEKLEALAKAASDWTEPGPDLIEVFSSREGYFIATEADMEFIAAANPAAVLELITHTKEDAMHMRAFGEVMRTQAEQIEQLKAENERLQRFETAYKEFSEKTDWVRPNAAAHELGMHVADILRKRCDDLTSHNRAQADEIKALRSEIADLAELKAYVTIPLRERCAQRLQVQEDNAILHDKIDRLLAHCPDGECATCGEIICPHGGAMHFHHDGCPSCAEHDESEQEQQP